MTPSLNLWAVLTLLGVVQALLLAMAVAGMRRGSRPANRLLTALLCVVSIVIAGNILTHTKYILMVPHFAQVHTPFGFLVGPLFFLYIRTLISRRFSFNLGSAFHFAPAVLSVAYLSPFYLQGGEYKVSYMIQALQNYPADWRFRTGIGLLQELVYFCLAASLVWKQRHNPKNQSSFSHAVNLFWLTTLLAGFALVWLVGVTRYAFAHRLQTNLFALAVASVFIYVMVFISLRRPDVLGEIEGRPSHRKYEKSTLKPSEADEILKRLMNLVATEKLYLDGNLTLEKLAHKLSILTPHLSQIVNERLSQSFPDFINSYRVEEFKRRLSDPQNQHYTIVAIAEASGFNSKSAFNSAFKRHSKMTPTQYRRTLSPLSH
jgi:AraC-like DNA-binding protein